MFRLLVSPEAVRDIQKAIDYYEEQQNGLGRKFLVAVDKHLKALPQNPYYQIRYKDYRALRIRKFPYLIIFYLAEATRTIHVVAVFHGAKHPSKRPK